MRMYLRNFATFVTYHIETSMLIDRERPLVVTTSSSSLYSFNYRAAIQCASVNLNVGVSDGEMFELGYRKCLRVWGLMASFWLGAPQHYCCFPCLTFN